MTAETVVGSGVELDATGIRIGGEPRILLCASLFYFRLPREEWRERLEQVRASGYTCIDVYFPWNFHETAPGQWSFEGRRDLAAFLDLAHAAGLFVIARPGPYICSEWDGGALPAWLTLDPQLRVRQREPRFLTQVGHWFDRVLPVLAQRQYPGGPVIMVQLENELDFFDCADRTGYLTALRDQALDHGVRVPMIACAGQGDLAGATGDVPHVVPACNFYPDDASPDVEAEVRHYAGLLAARGLPLLITETNRSHRTLRRMLASGASLLGPYLQSSGWNFGYTPATGNWGTPGNLMTHSYDFGGYVSAAGIERPGHAEARILARILDTLGSLLGRATPAETGVELSAGFPTSAAPAVLALPGGGRLLALPNLGSDPGPALLPVAGREPVAVEVPPDACPLVLLDLPLAAWGADLTLALASADLVAAAHAPGTLCLAFASPVPVTVVLDGLHPAAGPVEIAPGEWPVRQVWSGTDRGGRAVTVTLVVLSPADAARLDRLDADGGVEFTGDGLDAYRPGSAMEITAVTRRDGAAPARPAGAAELPPSLEAIGVYRGRGTYAASADLTGVDELLLVGAADLTDLTIAGRPRETVAGFGATARIDVRDVAGPAEVRATVEIWGHANFDDDRLPALRLGARRGLGTLWTVTGARDVCAHWTVSGPDQWAGDPAPIRSLGGWSSTRVARPITYTRDLGPAGAARALHLGGLAGPVRVRLDEAEPVTVHAEDPWLLLPPGTARVAVTMPHHPSGPRLRPELLTLAPVTGWACEAQDDETLLRYARDGAPGDTTAGLPLTVEAGTELWVDADLPPGPGGWLLHLAGAQLRATAWAAGECVGRVWLDDPGRPPFAGGDPGVLWIPRAWAAPGTRLTLLLRGNAGRATPVLTALRLTPAHP